MTPQTQPVQPEALRLAAWLNEGAWHNITLGDVNAAGRELRKLHAETERLTAALKKANEQAEHFEREWYLRGDELEQLQAELVREAQRTANEKLRADQMTEQHRMQAAMNPEARAELAQLRESKPLSDEQIRKAVAPLYADPISAEMGLSDYIKTARAIEAAHGIGEKTP